ARIKKVLPQYLDAKGRHTLSPSLYERDAYQALLRKNPKDRIALRFDVHWKASGVDGTKLKLRAELRGMQGNTVTVRKLEQAVAKKGWFGTWSALTLEGDGYKTFGAITAWRVSLWEGETQLAEQKSFLW